MSATEVCSGCDGVETYRIEKLGCSWWAFRADGIAVMVGTVDECKQVIRKWENRNE